MLADLVFQEKVADRPRKDTLRFGVLEVLTRIAETRERVVCFRFTCIPRLIIKKSRGH